MTMMPIGFRFSPTKEELIRNYLLPRVTGTPLPWDGIIIKALYGGAPWEVFSDCDGFWQPNLTECGNIKKNTSHVYVFTKLVRNPTNSQRTAGGGTWNGKGKPNHILDSQSGETIGYSRMYSYQHPDCGRASSKYKNWHMHEYVLSERMLQMIPNAAAAAAKDMVLCKITRTFNESGGSSAHHQPPQRQQFIPPAIADSPMQFFPPAIVNSQTQFIPPAIADSPMQFIPPATPVSHMQFIPPATPNSRMQFFPPAIDNSHVHVFPPAIVEEDDSDYIQISPFVEDDGGADYIPIPSPSNKRAAEEDCFQELHESGNKKQRLMDDEEGGGNPLEGVSIPEVDNSWIYSVVDFEEPISQLALESYENNEVPFNSVDDFSDVFGIRRGEIC